MFFDVLFWNRIRASRPSAPATLFARYSQWGNRECTSGYGSVMSKNCPLPITSSTRTARCETRTNWSTRQISNIWLYNCRRHPFRGGKVKQPACLSKLSPTEFCNYLYCEITPHKQSRLADGLLINAVNVWGRVGGRRLGDKMVFSTFTFPLSASGVFCGKSISCYRMTRQTVTEEVMIVL